MTRRASSLAAQSPSPHHHDNPSSDPPSTPPEHAHDETAESPANQRDLHQRRRRRSSAVSSVYADEDTLASATYDSDLENADSVADLTNVEMTGSSDYEDGTIMTVEAEEETVASVASVASAQSSPSGNSTGSLDENLRLAARRAVTQRLDDDGDEEVIAGFAGWGRKNHSQEDIARNINNGNRAPGSSADADGQASDMDADMDMDMDMTNVVGGILRPQVGSPTRDVEEDEDMSMDVTNVLGGILSKSNPQPARRKSVKPSAPQEADDFGEQTMDFTTVVGGIQNGRMSIGSQTDIDANEDMSMEFTTVVGGLLSAGFPRNGAQDGRRRTMIDITDDGDEGTMMDMTMPVGRILPAEDEQEEDGDQTMGMDMTTVVGGIIRPVSTSEARTAARKAMEQEADEPVPSGSASADVTYPTLPVSPIPNEAASPGLSAFQGRGLRRSPPGALPPVPRSPEQPSSSPFKEMPSPNMNTRTPPMIGSRSSSPVRNLSSPTRATPRSASRPALFHQDPSTGLSTPRIVLTPQGRRLSGVGADRPGLGSPRVAEIFDRRESIGEAATDFVPSQPTNPRRAVAFTNPRVIEAEINWERQDEHDGEQEVDGPQDDHGMTLNLKEMIEGLSPKKNPLRGRKSLHVGSARGLLGKRPVELDEDDEAEETDGVKRLRGHQGSPVKNIRLQSPPSKAETTTGRKTRPSIMPTEATHADSATPTVPSSPQRATTPGSQGRFRDADDEPTNVVDLGQAAPADDAEMLEDDGERIHLQDFLNMTSIRFMELTTTKRRHTVVPGASRDSAVAGGKDDLSLERCVVAGACTVPMLELYQHVSF